MGRQTHGKTHNEDRPCEDRGGDWSDTGINRGIARITKPPEASMQERKNPSPEPSGGAFPC